METSRSKTIAILIAFVLALSMLSLAALPSINAHTPKWNIPTYAYISVSPNPIGVGQTALVVFWIDKPLPSASMSNDIRVHDFRLTITKPDGTSEVENWPIVADTTSSQYMSFTPDQVGTYTFKFDYLGQTYTWSGTYQNDTYLPSSRTTTLIVQQEALPNPISSYPMPEEYWTRPVEGQNTDWYKISSNWLGDKDFSSAGSPQIVNDFQPDGIAPNSSHIMWTKWVNDGGVVGGDITGVDGNTFYSGSSYQQRFSKPIIMNGRLFYQLPYGNSAGGGGVQAVDLRTGENLWWLNTTGIGVPAFGYYYDYQTPNQHGVVPNGWLFTSNFARAIDPTTGIPTTINITNVPSGFEILGPSGEHLRFQTDSTRKWIAQWNSSNVFSTQTSGTINASLPSRYDWNVSAPWLMSGATVIRAFRDDILLGRNGSLPGIGNWGPVTMWAMSLKPASRGQLLWMKNIYGPEGNITLNQGPVDAQSRVFAFAYKETMQWVGYNLDTGEKIWGPTASQGDYDYYQFAMTGVDYGKVAYGNMYSSAYAGICYCYDMKTGNLLWSYGNGGPGNDTSVGLTAAWPNWPMQVFAIADGKVYLLTGEHSANSPLYKGPMVRCVDAYTGKEIWKIMGYGGYRTRTGVAIADGFFVYFNLYDSRIHCFGKGPSAITIEAPTTGIPQGSSLVIRGKVTDIAAGTKQKEQVARFPNGVPAVSDESMSVWMEYVYMQKPRPTDVKGVPVVLSVIDANGNFRQIANVTSDSDGFYSYDWTPDIPGKFVVYASFSGSESYWPSHEVTAFSVNPAPQSTPTEQPIVASPPTEMYFAISTAAIIIAIAVVGGLILLAVKKRP